MTTDNTTPPVPGLRDQIAGAIWERQNPGRSYEDCEYRWRADAEADADAVLAVVQPVIDEARATNRRLNDRAQQAESENATYRRAVGQWDVSERGTYIPLSSLRAIGNAAGTDILGSPRHLAHYERVEQAEAALARVRELHHPASYPNPDGPGEITYCVGCDDGDGSHPCPTVAALTPPVPADQPEGSSDAGIDWRDIAAQREEARSAAITEANRANAVLGAVTALAFDADLRPDVRLSRIRNLIDPADQPEGGVG